MQRKVGMAMLALVPSIVLSNGRTCTHVDDGSSGQNNYNYGNTNWPVQVGSYQECIALCESLGDDCPQGDYYPNRNGECYLYSNSGPNTCNPCTPGEDHFVCSTTTAGESFAPTVAPTGQPTLVPTTLPTVSPTGPAIGGRTCTHVDDGSSGHNYYNYGNTNWPVQLGSYQECIALCESLGDDCPQGDYYSDGSCYLYSNSGPNTCRPRCTPGEDHFVCSAPSAEEVAIVTEPCHKRVNVEYYGDDIKSMSVDSEETCAKKCYENEHCKYWTFRLGERRCWLKHGQGLVLMRRNRISGNRGCGQELTCQSFDPSLMGGYDVLCYDVPGQAWQDINTPCGMDHTWCKVFCCA